MIQLGLVVTAVVAVDELRHAQICRQAAQHVGIFARRPGAGDHTGFGTNHLGLRQGLLAITGIGDNDRA